MFKDRKEIGKKLAKTLGKYRKEKVKLIFF